MPWKHAPQNPEVESLEAGEATIGSVGPVTGTFGDTGDEIPLFAESCTYQGEETTTSTEWDSMDGSENVVQIPTPSLTEITGFETIQLRMLYNVHNAGANDTIHLRIRNEPDTEVTHTNPAFLQDWTPAAEIQSDSGISQYRPEIRCENGNEVELYRGTFVAFGVVE